MVLLMLCFITLAVVVEWSTDTLDFKESSMNISLCGSIVNPNVSDPNTVVQLLVFTRGSTAEGEWCLKYKDYCLC